ncbi:MAG TPA: type VI secretion system tube protein Hcp [Pirellulales bacterium]|jgi:type VI protein secretion system component Hcp|nr:type VI secretion system tube protein Hcp [Pirellulales bacterium]
MAKDVLDAFIELTPSKKMRAQIAGEAQGAGSSSGSTAAKIEITFFRFGSAESLAKAKQLRDRDKMDEGKQEELEQKEEDSEIRIARERTSKPTGETSQDYRFQITKEIERSSPFLMQAFLSDSYKPKRKEYNSFSEAKVTVRKLGHGVKQGSSQIVPQAFLEITFRGVYIVGYEIETRGKEPPEETVEFCFQTCEVKYISQAMTGELSSANSNIKGWNFKAQQELSS